MSGSLTRLVTQYFHVGFWVALSAATLNGMYWHFSTSTPFQGLP
jgi:hypothetical protein